MSTATSTPYQQLATAELERHGADTIGDLNNPRAPHEYVHYINARQFDGAILDARTDFQAICGFKWGQVPDIEDLCVNDGAEAEFCPLCWIIRHPFLFGLWK